MKNYAVETAFGVYLFSSYDAARKAFEDTERKGSSVTLWKGRFVQNQTTRQVAEFGPSAVLATAGGYHA